MQAKNLNEFVPDSIFEKVAGKFSRATHNLHQHIIYNQKDALDALLEEILGQINTKQITKNKKIVAGLLIDSPYFEVTIIEKVPSYQARVKLVIHTIQFKIPNLE